MPRPSTLAIVLAAGEGTRMKSAVPKVLHRVGACTLVGHVMAAVEAAGADDVAVVIGPDRADVAAEVRRFSPTAEVFEQRERCGTAHAVLAARTAIGRGYDRVLIVFGDTPLVRPETMATLAAAAEGAAVAVLGFRPEDPSGYGRLVTDGGRLIAIREEKDASAEEKTIGLCNAGLMAFGGGTALSLLERIGNANAKGEFYLTDAVELAVASGLKAVTLEAADDEVMGINDRAQLAAAEAVFQRRARAAALAGGATLVAPDTVFFSADTVLGRDVVVEPFVVFGPGVTVGDNVTIRAFSHLNGFEKGKLDRVAVEAGVELGPFARLRAGAAIGAGAHIGNFVEVKASTIGEGAKVNHLTYLGDASVGAGSNVGAGTITCNYDGYGKYRTTIGAGAFIGSNSSLVAPVTIGDGAYVGSGSVVTDDVPDHALAVARGRQVNKAGWAAEFRRLKGKP
ncbi:bifunctional UDP-N-acetylglucosamine diphosphorylase/glucosamine-1-phosphate N-acetyltransferase GlmU [Blastochloris viridis]|uniref:Bifunctional protein GlmU n=1 Tax=Blastochloris viridis TaxID=1079 RepID=A0A0H5BF41_BLAVI|nr:bifunctional UDP-N-acetylglucosamine diphosphorylase/glucosamine-1-phosphate N-acetyltransferase GlmU [Blastochloris viridis]ALK09286.1 Bifunctional protein GlmU [Blastochloris viridis]BAS00841.1 n-acetylglucosamine-1-phosphate uridyltransferase [Blastochloris viridis]CUU41949.1 Bifunctional protein GlmU [Blastochloris viridis]